MRVPLFYTSTVELKTFWECWKIADVTTRKEWERVARDHLKILSGEKEIETERVVNKNRIPYIDEVIDIELDNP